MVKHSVVKGAIMVTKLVASYSLNTSSFLSLNNYVSRDHLKICNMFQKNIWLELI